MPDYDAIVIGAGHNGLTALVVMARGGMRDLRLKASAPQPLRTAVDPHDVHVARCTA